MSNLNLIVFDLFSMEHSTRVPCCTLNINNLGMRSDDLFERRVFVSLDAIFVGAADGVCAVAATVLADDEIAADTGAMVAADVVIVVWTAVKSASGICSGPVVRIQ